MHRQRAYSMRFFKHAGLQPAWAMRAGPMPIYFPWDFTTVTVHSASATTCAETLPR